MSWRWNVIVWRVHLQSRTVFYCSPPACVMNLEHLGSRDLRSHHFWKPLMFADAFLVHWAALVLIQLQVVHIEQHTVVVCCAGLQPFVTGDCDRLRADLNTPGFNLKDGEHGQHCWDWVDPFGKIHFASSCGWHLRCPCWCMRTIESSYYLGFGSAKIRSHQIESNHCHYFLGPCIWAIWVCCTDIAAAVWQSVADAGSIPKILKMLMTNLSNLGQDARTAHVKNRKARGFPDSIKFTYCLYQWKGNRPGVLPQWLWPQPSP